VVLSLEDTPLPSYRGTPGSVVGVLKRKKLRFRGNGGEVFSEQNVPGAGHREECGTLEKLRGGAAVTLAGLDRQNGMVVSLTRNPDRHAVGTSRVMLVDTLPG